MRTFKPFLLLLFLSACFGARAQTCPDNIDFSTGTFTRWACSTGTISPEGEITLNPTGPVANRQTLISNKSTAVDYYGDFSVVAPNGATNTLKLGNEAAGHQAEQVSYTYTIPNDKSDYVFTYYYAVVLQLTAHLNFERPRFSVRLTDLTAKEIIQCGTHDFVSGDGLGDFKKSKVAEVEYRDWSTVAVNLAGRAGHTVQFDFTTNDCVYNAHFGYAYLAFDDPCLLNKNPISGTNYCNGANVVTLTAPPGFGQYAWHNDKDPEITISSDRQLVLSPVPPDGSKFTVEAVSLSGVGVGCPAYFAAVVHKIDEDYIFNLKNSVTACEVNGVDLTDKSLTAGSNADMTFKYYVDEKQLVAVRDPTLVTKPGFYWIKGTNGAGCSDVKKIEVILIPNPVLKITNPKRVCVPETVDITNPAIMSGSSGGLILEYFLDALATKPVPNPKALTAVGSYYIKATNSYGCSIIAPVKVDILPIPYIKSNTVFGCSPFNITSPVYHADDTNGLIYKYFKDAATTIPLEDPEKITQEGTFYVTAVNEIGCPTPAPVAITVKLYPSIVFDLQNIVIAKYPAEVDLSTAFTSNNGYTYSYYTDSLATNQLSNFKTINVSGRYFIKAVTADGCSLIKPVNVVINPPDEAGISVGNTFTPNADGINDEFAPVTTGAATVNYLRIFSRSGAQVFETKDLGVHWRGNMNGSPLPAGTYYWVFNCYDVYRKKEVTQSGYITLIR